MGKHHGFSNTPLYGVWEMMVQRCCNPKAQRWETYGGRGIKVCPEWRASPKAFCEWALSSGYKIGLTLDRRDNDGDYTPDNCRWVSGILQASNTTRVRLYSAFGETKTIQDWADDPRCKISYRGLIYRLNQGLSIETALTKPSVRN